MEFKNKLLCNVMSVTVKRPWREFIVSLWFIRVPSVGNCIRVRDSIGLQLIFVYAVVSKMVMSFFCNMNNFAATIHNALSFFGNIPFIVV